MSVLQHQIIYGLFGPAERVCVLRFFFNKKSAAGRFPRRIISLLFPDRGIAADILADLSTIRRQCRLRSWDGGGYNIHIYKYRHWDGRMLPDMANTTRRSRNKFRYAETERRQLRANSLLPRAERTVGRSRGLPSRGNLKIQLSKDSSSH